MKNCIGKELSKIPMPVSTKYDVMNHVMWLRGNIEVRLVQTRIFSYFLHKFASHTNSRFPFFFAQLGDFGTCYYLMQLDQCELHSLVKYPTQMYLPSTTPYAIMHMD